MKTLRRFLCKIGIHSKFTKHAPRTHRKTHIKK